MLAKARVREEGRCLRAPRDPDGFPIFGNHGCPGCRFDRCPDEALSYGRTEVSVPPGHGHWLASPLPRRDAWVDDEAGHFAQDPASDVRKRLEWLLDRRVDAA
jgi:hypothetical protein